MDIPLSWIDASWGAIIWYLSEDEESLCNSLPSVFTEDKCLTYIEYENLAWGLKRQVQRLIFNSSWNLRQKRENRHSSKWWLMKWWTLVVRVLQKTCLQRKEADPSGRPPIEDNECSLVTVELPASLKLLILSNESSQKTNQSSSKKDIWVIWLHPKLLMHRFAGFFTDERMFWATFYRDHHIMSVCSWVHALAN